MSHHSPPAGAGHTHKTGRPLHRDWRIWLAVILMLAAMAAYILTMDEQIVPGAPAGSNPSAASPPAPR